MLFDVAALLITSVTAGPVAEAFGVPQNPVSAVSQPYVGPEPGLGPDVQIGTGSLMLDQLAFVPAGELERFVAENPAAMADLLKHPPAARDVSLWWGALPAQYRAEFVAAAPEVAGNLDGLPFTVRDQANRQVLSAALAELKTATVAAVGRAIAEDSQRRIAMLREIEKALTGADGAPRILLSLDVTGQGKAAVVVGDLRTADYVSYLVPGMFFTIEGQIGDWTTTAAQLQEAEEAWLARLGQPGEVATVAWIGYETPNLTNVGSLDLAHEGSAALAGAIQGLLAQRAGHVPYVTIVAHSYGATAALLALERGAVQVDAFAMLGSPGSGAQSVEQLAVRGGNVWVAEAAWDPVPNSAFFGSDPGAPSYGANLMSVDGGTDAITGRALSAAIGHIGYFAPDSEAMRNLALISIDRPDLVSR